MAPGRRRLLLETAAREFARAGYERASLNRIIHGCGMSKGSFHYYLASKEALFDAVVAEGGAVLVAALGRARRRPVSPTRAGPRPFAAAAGCRR